jgi:hypothetical protein
MAELTGLPFESGRKGSAWSDLGRAPNQDCGRRIGSVRRTTKHVKRGLPAIKSISSGETFRLSKIIAVIR